ncbi:MAG: hypothetical protein DRQ89_15555 [Epsilonproteobacteria bacterium]|nr:MAG: hypothetical protein DRQ89_15555 [Campylobacterota bacterium]
MSREKTTLVRMKTIKSISFVVLLALLVGCATTFRPWEFTNVKEGMDRAQVVKIIGEPDRVESKDGAEFLYYSYHEAYDPTSENGLQASQVKRSMKTRNYIVKMVDGKVQTAEEAQPSSTL